MPSACMKKGAWGVAASALALAIVLSACATPPKPQDLPFLPTPDSLVSAESLAGPQAPWPSDGWWRSFEDPQLTALIEEGLQGAADIRIAQARLQRAEAFVRQARSRLLPNVNGGFDAGLARASQRYTTPDALTPDGVESYGELSANLGWTLDFWGKNRAALAAAQSEAKAVAAEAAAARLAISSGVAQAYADLAALYAQRDAAERAIEVRRRTLELMSGRVAQGLETTAAEARVQSALSTALGDREALNEAITLAGHGLAALIGAGPDRALSMQRPAPVAQKSLGLPAHLPADLIGRRPEIVAARLRAEAAASTIRVAHAAFYPNVDLKGVIGLQSIGLDALFKSGSDFGVVGPAVTLPIFSGGRLTGRYRAAEAEYVAAAAQYDDALVQALREVADVVASRRALERRLAYAANAEQAALSAWTVASNRYRGGLGTYLDVLAAEDALIAARRAEAVLQTRAFALDVALMRALGGGYRS